MMNVIWIPPLSGWIKGNTNGVAIGTSKSSACGAMFENSLGDHVRSFSSFIGNITALMAEFLGVIMTMKIAIYMNWYNL